MTDGVTLNVLGSDGKVYSLGENDFGQMGTGMMSFRIYTTGMCMDNAGANGVSNSGVYMQRVARPEI